MGFRESPVLVEMAGDLENAGYEPETLMTRNTEAGVTPTEELREWVRVRERPEGAWHGCVESNQIDF